MKGYGFFSFVRNMAKVFVKIWIKLKIKNWNKNLNTARNLLIMQESLLQMQLKLLQKDYKKQLDIWLAIKLLAKFQKSQNCHYRIIQEKNEEKILR